MSFTPGGKPIRQESLDSIVLDLQKRLKKLEDEIALEYQVNLRLLTPPTVSGEVPIWNGTGWEPELIKWLVLARDPTHRGQIATWDGKEWNPQMPEEAGVSPWVYGTGGADGTQRTGARLLGGGSLVLNLNAVAEGEGSVASGIDSHAEGFQTQALGDTSHSEGNLTVSRGRASHTEGDTNTANGVAAHGEGYGGQATGDFSHSEGFENIAIGLAAHTEGENSIATGEASHVEGHFSQAIGDSSHAQNDTTKSIGIASHVEGSNGSSAGDYSHAQNLISLSIGESSDASGIRSFPVQRGERAHGSWRGFVGSSQYSRLILSGLTRSNEDLVLNDVSDDIGVLLPRSILLNSEATQFHIQITGLGPVYAGASVVSPTGACGVEFKGLAFSDGTTARIVGTPSKETWADSSLSSFDVQLVANGREIQVKVTGVTDVPISWVAVCHLSRVYEPLGNVYGIIGRSESLKPLGIAVDSTYIYWTTYDTVGRATKDGSVVEPYFIKLTSTAGGPGGQIAISPTKLIINQQGLISSANHDGSSLVGSWGGTTGPPPVFGSGLAIDSSYAFVSGFPTGISVYNVDGSGGASGFIIDDPGLQVVNVAVYSGYVYYTTGLQIIRQHIFSHGYDILVNIPDFDPEGIIYGIAVDSDGIWWSVSGGPNKGNIGHANLDGSDPTNQFSGTGFRSGPLSIATDVDHIWVANPERAAIGRVNKTGSIEVNELYVPTI